MLMNITIEKDFKEDCPISCPFRKDHYNKQVECTLFNTHLEDKGCLLNQDIHACQACQKMYSEQHCNV